MWCVGRCERCGVGEVWYMYMYVGKVWYVGVVWGRYGVEVVWGRCVVGRCVLVEVSVVCGVWWDV